MVRRRPRAARRQRRPRLPARLLAPQHPGPAPPRRRRRPRRRRHLPPRRRPRRHRQPRTPCPPPPSPAPPLLDAWWTALQRLAHEAPDCVALAAAQAPALLADPSGVLAQNFVAAGLKAYAADRTRRRAFFALEDPWARTLLTRRPGLPGFDALARTLTAYAAALWGPTPILRAAPPSVKHGSDAARPRATISGPVVLLPATPDPDAAPTAASARALYRATVAHAGAHLALPPVQHQVGDLKPLQLALITLIEDARVEALALRAYPGLRRLWAPFHTAPPSGPRTAPNLMARLARALFDATHPNRASQDPDGFVAKGARLFAEAAAHSLDDPALSLRIGRILGHDLGQLRVQFNWRDYVVEPPYRDDGHHLWEPPPDAQPAQHDLHTQAARPNNRPNTPPNDDAQPKTEPTPTPQQWPVAPATKRRTSAASSSPPTPNGIPPSPPSAPTGPRSEKSPPAPPTRPRSAPPSPPSLCSAAASPASSAPPPSASPPASSASPTATTSTSTPPSTPPSTYDPAAPPTPASIASPARAAATSPPCCCSTPPPPPPPQPVRAARAARPARAIARLANTARARTTFGSGPATGHNGPGPAVLDVQRLAVALLAEALDTVADPVALRAFASDGRADIRLTRIKDLTEPFDAAALARLAGLRAALSTRLGPALRHARTELAPTRAWRRLLLVLTDGEPSDIDLPDNADLIHDARRAVLQLRAAGIDVFGIVLDPAGVGSATTIFGRSNTIPISDLADLPARLAGLYFRLARR